MATQEMTIENFQQTVDDNSIVILDFWAEWCAPCKTFGPIFEELSNENPDLVFGKIDTEAQQALAGQFGIQSIPTVAAFRDQIVVFMQPGALPKDAMQGLIDQIKALDMDDVREQVAKAEAEQKASNAG